MKKVKVPLSKLHFQLYNPEDGQNIEMGDGIKSKINMWEAWTDDIDKLNVKSVEFPKFDYLVDLEKQAEEPCAILTVHEFNDFKDGKLPSESLKVLMESIRERHK